jgi:hypothetical protein
VCASGAIPSSTPRRLHEGATDENLYPRIGRHRLGSYPGRRRARANRRSRDRCRLAAAAAWPNTLNFWENEMRELSYRQCMAGPRPAVIQRIEAAGIPDESVPRLWRPGVSSQ